MCRGGSWYNNTENCRTAYRNRNAPGNRNNNLGLRVCFRLHGLLVRLDRRPERPGLFSRPAWRLAVLTLIPRRGLALRPQGRKC